MALFTTYLGYLNTIRRSANSYIASVREALKNIGLQNPSIKYVMLGRGNDEVAPDEDTVKAYKNGEISWKQYAIKYFEKIQFESGEARRWIDNVAEETLFHDVVLVCYEKDHVHCHRTLLAQEIVRRHPEANYVGDLQRNSRRQRMR